MGSMRDGSKTRDFRAQHVQEHREVTVTSLFKMGARAGELLIAPSEVGDGPAEHFRLPFTLL